MVALIDNAELSLIRGERYVSPRVSLARLTDTVSLSVARQTADNSVLYGRDCKLRLRLFVRDGRQTYTVEDTDVGRVVELRGRQSAFTTIAYTLPHGFFGRRSGYPERLGERASNYEAWCEVECLFGSLETTLTLEASESPAPRVAHHSSVAYDNASAALSTASGTTISVNHTATGTDQAAFIGGWFDITTAPTSLAATYGGNAATAISGFNHNPQFGQRQTGFYVLDASIAAGSQSVVVTRTGGADPAGSKAVVVVSLTGVDQTTPVGTPQIAGATSGTTPSVTVTGTAAGGMLVDFLCAWLSTGGITAGADQTERINDSTISSFRAGASTQLSSAGGVMSWSKSSLNEYAIGAVEFKAAAGGGGGSIVRQMMQQGLYAGGLR